MPIYKNHFASSKFFERKILNEEGKVVGTIRLKPVSIAWKPRGRGKFFTVPLDDFIAWILDPETKANETSS